MGEGTAKRRTQIERRSDLELVVTRVFDAPVRLVFDAWAKAELFQLWWAPKSIGMKLLSCEIDARTGGGYRLVFAHGESGSMAFFGKYLEVVPPSRMVWTNDEGGGAVTTVTFEEKDGGTLVVLREVYPSREAFDADAGHEEAMPEQFEQLDELLKTQGATV